MVAQHYKKITELQTLNEQTQSIVNYISINY